MKPFGIQFWKLLSITAFGILCSTSAHATTYKCSPKQRFTWMHGTLQQLSLKKPIEFYRFDDETGVLLVNVSPAEPASPMQFDIVQRMTPGNDLVALTHGFVNGHFNGNQTLTIRSWDKTAGLVYLLTEADAVSSGRCSVSDSGLSR